MSSAPILTPVIAMFLLTFVVWVYMYVLRISYMRREQIHPQKVRSPQRKHNLIPEAVNYPADNLANLTELPVIFYAVCLLLYVTGLADATDVAVAWGFALLRAVHSLIQCTVNQVLSRFGVYMFASLLLWFMVLRTTWRMVSGT